MAVVLQIDAREANDLDWLDDLKFEGKIAGVTMKTVKVSIPVLQVKRGEKLIILDNDSWVGRLSSSYLIEVRYANGYREYQNRLQKPGTHLTRLDKLPLFEGAYIETCLKWQADFDAADLNRGTSLKYTRSDTWYGCYLKGKIMKTHGFLEEAIMWLEQAKTINPLRLEVLLELHNCGKTPHNSEISEALEALESPFYQPARETLSRLIEAS